MEEEREREMKSAMPALRRRRRAAYARSVGTQVVDEERADRRRRRRRQDTAILAKLTCHPRLRPPSSPSPSPSKVPPFISRRRRRRRPTRWTPPRSADSYVVCTACVRSFARSLARSFVQVFSNGSPIARSLAPLDGGIRWSERAGGACGGISGLYGLDGGRASVRSVRLGTRNERTKKQMLTLETPSFWQLWVKQFKAKRDLIVYGICNINLS